MGRVTLIGEKISTTSEESDIKLTYDYLRVHYPRCVFMQIRVGGSVKTQLSYDRDLLV